LHERRVFSIQSLAVLSLQQPQPARPRYSSADPHKMPWGCASVHEMNRVNVRRDLNAGNSHVADRPRVTISGISGHRTSTSTVPSDLQGVTSYLCLPQVSVEPLSSYEPSKSADRNLREAVQCHEVSNKLSPPGRRDDMRRRRWQFDPKTRRIYVRPRICPQSAHLW